MTELPSFFILWILLCTVIAPVHTGQEINSFENFSFSGLQAAAECLYQ